MSFTIQSEFINPSAKYRAIPFWSWNGDLRKEELRKQIDSFKQMGYGGFVIHTRIGLREEYLGPLFADCVNYCIDYARENDMYVCLYDEDKWPSGYGAGAVTKNNPEFRARALLITKRNYPDGFHLTGRKQRSRMTENGVLGFLSAYVVSLDEKGFITSYRKTERNDEEANLFAFEVVTDELEWFNNSAYTDLLNPEAVKKFIEVSYERYRKITGERFGTDAKAIFTDEPQHTYFNTLKDAFSDDDLILPWTLDMNERFGAEMGYPILDKLPEVIWNTSDMVSQVRYHFYLWISRVFTDSYFRTLGQWCREKGIMFAGHLLKEESLASLSQCSGDAMMHYSCFDIPGLDILADRREFQSAKQVQGIRNQYGKNGVICELFGVTNWDFPFRGHIRQANWLMALGTSVRLPHLAWMYMGGESKRDYPAPLDFHSPWNTCYKYVEDSLARTNLFVSQGKPCTRVAVLNPVESYWAISGPDNQTQGARDRMNRNLHSLIDRLLLNQIDFDFVSESSIPELSRTDCDGRLCLGRMNYDVLIVPQVHSVRKTTVDFIKDFSKYNGHVFMLGNNPCYLDGEKAEIDLGKCVTFMGFDLDALADALEPYREIRILDNTGRNTDNIIYHLNRDGEDAYLFITACGKAADTTGFSAFRKPVEDPVINVSVKGSYSVQICNGLTGQIKKIHSTYHNGWTSFTYVFYDNDSLMAFLSERDVEEPEAEKQPVFTDSINITAISGFSLEEDNVLVLDMPFCQMDGIDFGKEYILRADDRFRETAGYRKRTDSSVQPWVNGNKNNIEHSVVLSYVIESETDGLPVDLAYEGDADISFNGLQLTETAHRTYVDRTISRISLGMLRKGRNELSMIIPFGSATNLEACFLLGRFGVRLEGDNPIVVDFPYKLGWYPLTMQGMPFYGGNIDYITEISIESEGHYCVTIPHFNAPVIDVEVDENQPVHVIKEPFRADLGHLDEGKHIIKFKYYGTRINQFGQIHNTRSSGVYWGPASWRTTGPDWSYSYQLRDTGMLAEPVVRRIE